MDPKLIDRINVLAKKSKEEGLSEEEKSEQQKLRREYINIIKRNLKADLKNISIVEKDGSITDLGKKFGGVKDE